MAEAVAFGMGRSPTAAEFAQLCRAMMLGKGNPLDAANLGLPLLPRTAGILQKAAVAAGGLDTPDWGNELGGYSIVTDGFIESLRNNAFDKAFPFMRKAPLRTRIAAVSAAAVRSPTGNGAAIPLTKMELSAPQLEVFTVTALVILSEGLLRAGAEGVALLTRELQGAVGSATDTQFLTAISGLLRPLDVENFAVWCGLQARIDSLLAEGEVPGRDLLGHYRSLSASFGLNPDARSKMGRDVLPPKKQDPDNPFNQF